MLTDQQLNEKIAVLQGYEENFTTERDEETGLYVTWDAECEVIPDYVKILGQHGAAQFLQSLCTIKAFKEQNRRY